MILPICIASIAEVYSCSQLCVGGETAESVPSAPWAQVINDSHLIISFTDSSPTPFCGNVWIKLSLRAVIIVL